MADRLKRRTPNRVRPWLRRLACAAVALGCAAGLSSCTRSYFRRAADKEVDAVLCEKDKYPQWGIQQYHVYPDPLARFADPTDPDRPPMPPDDPAAWDLAPHPQRPILKGYAYWQGTGYLELMRRWDTENRARAEAAQVETEKKEQASSEEEEPKLMGEDKTFAQRAREIDQNIDAELAGPIPPMPGDQRLDVSLEAPQPSKYPPFRLNLEQITELGFLNSPQFQTQR